MEAGNEPPLMTIEARDGRSVPLAVGICFEAAYPLVIGDGVARGGQAIIVPSNNYHFRSSANRPSRDSCCVCARWSIRAAPSRLQQQVIPT